MTDLPEEQHIILKMMIILPLPGVLGSPREQCLRVLQHLLHIFVSKTWEINKPLEIALNQQRQTQ